MAHNCSYGASVVLCNEVGHWEYQQDDCACATDGIWAQAELNTVSEVICGNGGRLRRTCLTTGFWDEVQNFRCKCPAEGIWGETDAGTYARAGCGNGFIRRLCGDDGQWTDTYDRSACYCSPQSGWQLTLSGETAIKSCPVGEMTRTCDQWGTWGPIDSSKCMCEALDGFDVTPVKTRAEAPCFDADGVPDPVNKQYRYCGADGQWGEVDQMQCPVKWCPTVQSWYKVPVGSRPTTVTIGCMHGERSRVCNVNGVWGPVNIENCHCMYSTETQEDILLPPGSSYQLPCSVGERVFTCNSESGYFDPVDLSTCKCGADGQFATTPAGELASASCSSGTATRICSLDGEWEERDIRNCFCGADGVWRQTEPGSTVSVLCDVGFRLRECSDYGFWETAHQDTCKCSEDGREADFGTAVSEQCEEGSVHYVCGADGHFAEPDISSCFCPSRYEFGLVWNRIQAGQQSYSLTCMNGASVRRTCSAVNGHWEDLDATTCRCETMDVWSGVGVGEYATAPCINHSTGIRRRQCYGYQWGPIDDSECQEACVYNFGNGNVTYVAVGDTLQVSCYVNMDGAMTYECQRDETTGQSVLTLKESTCTRLACVNDANELVNVGESETSPCNAGFSGNKTRTCLSGALWSEFDLSGCKPLICTTTVVERVEFPHIQGPIVLENVTFPYTLANTTADVECPTGYHGALRLLCDIEGHWGTEVINDCVLNECPAEGEWPATKAYENYTLTCPSDYTGTWTRACQADGTWEELVVPATCIPIPPTVKTVPYPGMTHVSRAPSAALFSSLAIKAPYSDCTVDVVSTTDETERYELRVNVTKTSMIGRHRNGGVFADFALPESADIHDLSNYLGYGEYKMIFPSCWYALNNATIPETPLEVTFTTTPVPPSAPANVVLEYGSETFTVHFDAPLIVDAPYPVTAYYLAFQPPVLPEVRVDANTLSFGPFPYLPGHVTLLLRAENAYGLSSPDVEAPYDFNEVLMDAGDRVGIKSAAPILSLVSQEPQENSVSVTVMVSVPVALHPFVNYLDVTCNDEAVEGFSSLEAARFTTAAEAGSDLTVTCYFTLGGTSGLHASLTIPVIASETPYGAVSVTAKEEEASLLHLQWTQPDLFSTTPIRAYIVQCRLQDQTEFSTSHFVTALDAVVSVAEFVPGPVECRVAASASLSLPEQPNWGYVSVSEVHSIQASDLAVTVEPHAVDLTVRVTSPYCVAASAVVLLENREMASQKLNCEESVMTGIVAGLKPETAYTVVIKVPSLGVEEIIEVTTQALQNESLSVELVEDSITSSSAVLSVTTSSPDAVYCIASTQPISSEQLIQEAAAGLLDDLFVPASSEAYTTTHSVYLQDLMPHTRYAVTCLARYSLATMLHTSLFTTASTKSPLLVREVTTLTPAGRVPSFLFQFDGAIQLGSEASVWVNCGGMTKTYELEEMMIEGVNHSQLRIQLQDEALTLLPAGTLCSLGFTSLDAVQRLHGEDTRDLLSETPMPSGTDRARFEFTISQDAMSPVLTVLLAAELEEDKVLVATVSEEVVTLSPFTYQLECSRRGESTVQRSFDSTSHPLIVRMGSEARKGYTDMLIHTGFLPHLHECVIRFPAYALGDAVQNPIVCEGEDCSVSFVSRVSAPDQMKLELVSVTPVDGSESVAINVPIVLIFNRDVVATKPVVMRCMDCLTPSISLMPVCSGTRCLIENTVDWEADTTYYLTYDATTFRAAWETFFLAVPERFTSFTTAASACNMEFIAAEWDTSCSCINTGSHCQCNCGATAILKAF